MAPYDRLSRSDFTRFERMKPVVVHGKLFSLAVFTLPEDRGPAIACVIAKKVAAKATRRNTIRRQCREEARAGLQRKSGGKALIFRAKRSALDATSAEIRDDIRSLVGRSADAR